MPTPPPDELDDWDFPLPPDRVARHPPPVRSDARLLVVPAGGPLADRGIRELPGLLRPGDLLVANDSRVVPARLRARRATGGRVELLITSWAGDRAEALARPARKLPPGTEIAFGDEAVRVVGASGDGVVEVAFPRAVEAFLEDHGEVPLPPYLERDAEPDDRHRYQTVYAGRSGSVAAPTAGLHFDPPLLAALAAAGIGWTTVTLHVGIGTFRPLRAEDVARGTLHPERWEVPVETAARVAETRAAGGRVFAVGTTAARTLQSATPPGGRLPTAGAGTTTLFLKPPDRPTAFDGLLTNFHLPRSSLLMLVATLTGKERLFAAYGHAIGVGYRFFSYGDAMLVLP